MLNLECRSGHFVVRQQLLQPFFRVNAHRAEFIEPEGLSPPAAADLGEDGAALGIVDDHRQGNRQQNRSERRQGKHG